MIKKINVMGIELDNYSSREAMMLVETFLNNTVLNTIEEVPLQVLVQAKENEDVRQSIRALDLAIPGDREILVEAGYGNSRQINDVEENSFFHEFIRRVIRNKKKVFLLGETQAVVDELTTVLKEDYERLQIIGSCCLERFKDDAGVINEINSQAPDVILSALPSPKQELFILEQKGRLHAKIWYGMNNNVRIRKGKERLIQMIRTMVGRVIFRHQILKYQRKE